MALSDLYVIFIVSIILAIKVSIFYLVKSKITIEKKRTNVFVLSVAAKIVPKITPNITKIP